MLTVEKMRRIEERILQVHEDLTKIQIERLMEENNKRCIRRLRNYVYEANNGIDKNIECIIIGEKGKFKLSPNGSRIYLDENNNPIKGKE